MVRTLYVALATALVAVLGHSYVHSLFIPYEQFSATGALQANFPVIIVIVLGIYAMTFAVEALSGWKLFVAGFIIWLAHAVAHDGTHLLYLSFDELGFGMLGVPESGMTIAFVYLVGLVYIWFTSR